MHFSNAMHRYGEHSDHQMNYWARSHSLSFAERSKSNKMILEIKLKLEKKKYAKTKLPITA